MSVRTEKQWEEWWAQQFTEVSKPGCGLNCTDLTNDFGYPAASLDTPQGTILVEHMSGDICKVYWPGGSVGRLYVSRGGDAFQISPDGSYGWCLEQEESLYDVLFTAICLLEWADTKVVTEQGED